jgi:diguanylate cyclase (GGDEF)-like protein
MGSPLQEILQGRGDKKGQGFRIKRTVPLLFLVSIWIGLFNEFPLSRTVLWFFFSAAVILLYSFLHFAGRRREFSIEFLFSVVMLLAGLIQILKLPWLKLAYFPLIISMTALYPPSVIIPLSLLIPFLWLKDFISMENITDESAFSAFLVSAAVISSTVSNKLRKGKEKAVTSLKTIKDKALNMVHETDMDSISSDKAMSHYLASMMKTDEEIKDLLQTIRQAVFADSANLFVPYDNGFMLRCSSDENSDINIGENGMILECMREKKMLSSSEVNEKKIDPGYTKNNKISSIIAVPVVDGSAILGSLSVDSSRYHAFREPDKRTLMMFADYLVRVLERERVYPKIKRDYNGAKILQEESSKLVSSLNMDFISEKLCEGATRIVFSKVYFFISREKDFELIQGTGNVDEKGKRFNLRGTLINMAVENKMPMYLSDIKDYRIPIMPFKAEDVQSVIVIPLLYENNLLGLLVMLLGKTEFPDTFQRELLNVMCNQAATSIANAKLHSEIEKLAITDGLTGLFNHRTFQEKLSLELRRLNRFSGPLSILISDIDYFKKINDSYGHPAGDLVLKEVAKKLKDTVRDVDVPARYGGEEFAAILPGTDSEGAKIIAERLRKGIRDSSFSAGGAQFRITISIGIATSSDAKKKEDLIEKADKALYYAKHHGRNQTVLWNSIK